jgi:hypothetical protein
MLSGASDGGGEGGEGGSSNSCIGKLGFNHTGHYSLRATNADGSTISQAAPLVMNKKPFLTGKVLLIHCTHYTPTHCTHYLSILARCCSPRRQCGSRRTCSPRLHPSTSGARTADGGTSLAIVRTLWYHRRCCVTYIVLMIRVPMIMVPPPVHVLTILTVLTMYSLHTHTLYSIYTHTLYSLYTHTLYSLSFYTHHLTTHCRCPPGICARSPMWWVSARSTAPASHMQRCRRHRRLKRSWGQPSKRRGRECGGRECRGRECRGRECRGRECRGRECRGVRPVRSARL